MVLGEGQPSYALRLHTEVMGQCSEERILSKPKTYYLTLTHTRGTHATATFEAHIQATLLW